jgi:DNA-binding transcriptional ArsR family regulator
MISPHDEMEQLFLALSDKTRIRLIGLMSDGEVSVNYLCDALGESQPKVSRHLAYLRNTGVVSTRRDGKWIYYSLSWPTHPTGAKCFADILTWITPARSHLRAKTPFSPNTAEETSDSYRVANDDIYEKPHMLDSAQDDLDIFLL